MTTRELTISQNTTLVTIFGTQKRVTSCGFTDGLPRMSLLLAETGSPIARDSYWMRWSAPVVPCPKLTPSPVIFGRPNNVCVSRCRRPATPLAIQTSQRRGFMLLVGPAAAGKTRCAYEAVRPVVPDWRLVMPPSGRFLAELVEASPT